MHMARILFPNAIIRTVALLLLLWGSIASTQAQGCSQPSNLNSNVFSPGSVSLRWSAIQGARSYTLQYRLGNTGAWTIGGTITATNLTISNLLPERVYTWRVKASCSTYSSVATFNSGGGVGGNTACSSPSNQQARSLSSSSVSLSWSAIEGSFNYTVQYRRSNVSAWTTAGSVPGTSLTLSGLVANSEYNWRVKASCSVYSSIDKFNTGGTTGGGGTGTGGGSTSCSAPSNTNTNVVFSTSAQVSWEPQGGALNYTLQYRLATSSTYVTVGTVTAANATITGLQAGREYVWRVKANCSPYGSDVQFSTPFAFTGSTAAAPLNTQANLRLFPNPVTADLVHIQTEGTGGQLFILNSAGQVVANELITDGVQTLDVSRLNNGLYFVRVQEAGGKSQVQKLVVAH